MTIPNKLTIQSGGKLSGQIQIPGDKSISHRALMLAAIAEGTSEVKGFLPSQDCHATLKALASLGVRYKAITDEHLLIHGVGLYGLSADKNHVIDMGNAGTGMRLIAGLLAGQAFSTILTGDASLQKRPMARIMTPLLKMGAVISGIDNEYPPLKIIGNQQLIGCDYELPIASAQIKSCLILAALYAKGQTTLIEPISTRDHTERLWPLFGGQIECQHNTIKITGQTQLQATRVTIPGDFSHAAFFIVGACIAKDSDLLIQNVGINPTRIGMLHILREMGARINILNAKNLHGEPVADIHVQYSALKGIEIPQQWVSLAIDEFPAIFIAAACATGTTVLRGAEELRVKECDRLHVMAKVLGDLGISVTEYTDGLAIEGSKIRNGQIDSHGDHRVLMATAMAALAADEPITITNSECVATSFANFVSLAQQCGLRIYC